MQTLISVVFMLVFWGGLLFFTGEAIVAVLLLQQQVVLRRIGIYNRGSYFNQSVLGKVLYIFGRSSVAAKIVLTLLCVLYAMLTAAFVSVADTSLQIARTQAYRIASHPAT